MKRRWLIGLIVLGVVIVVVAAVAVITVLRPEDSSGPHPARPDLPVREELIEQARPDPDCSLYPRPEPSGSGEVRLGVLRLRGHCLIGETVLTTEDQADSTLADLRTDETVVAADRAPGISPPPTPDDPHGPGEGEQEKQWSLDQLGGDALDSLWPEEAPEIRVGVVDSGIDTTHAEFGDRVIKVKDTELGSDAYESHGTFVAGIIAAADDGTGVTGIAPKVKLLDAQYWRDGKQVGEDGIHDEIVWSVDNGARVINASAGDDDNSLLRAAYSYAELNRVVIIPAVGNCGSADWRPWPHNWSDYDKEACDREDRVAGQADQPTGLGVGALNSDGDRAGFSSENRTVMIMAPGEEILSTCVTRHAGPRTLCTDNGSSFAAPQVSGAVAILLARHPEATPADIRQALIMTTDPVDVERGQRNDEYGYGRLNIIAAAKYLDDHPPQPLPEEPAIAAAIIGGTESIKHTTELVLTGRSKIEVQQLDGAARVPEIAFSADGAWFAATDGKTLTVVDALTGRQQSTKCTCRGVAFNTKNQVLTAQGGDQIKIAHYEPMEADWASTTFVPGAPQSEDDPATVVGAAGDVALVTTGQPNLGTPQRLLGIWPDSKAITLLETREGVGQVATSPDGRWLVAAGSKLCWEDGRQHRLIDVEQTQALGQPSAKWLTPWAILSCAATSLHFEGTDLYAGWVAASDGVRDLCTKAGPSGTVVVTARLPIGEFKPSNDYTRTAWQDLDCATAGIWHPSDGAQIRLRAGPPARELHAMPVNYTLIRQKPQGEGEQVLAEKAEIIVVRPR